MATPQTVLITGAAQGIGRQTALHLARRGHRVLATGRKPELLAQLEAEAPAGRLETFRLDVCDPGSIAAALEEVGRRTGGQGIDALVNNAGYGLAGPLELVSDVDLRAQFETNVFGLMAVTRAFLPGLRARGRGRIVNVSSVGGRVTFPFMGAYHASKYAVEALSDALRMEMRPFGVHVVVVEPGFIRSGFSERTASLALRYREHPSPYSKILVRVEEMQSRSDAFAVGPEVVARAIEKALVARRPRSRYVIPFFRARLLLFFLPLFPTRVMDAVMRWGMGLTPKALGLLPPAG